MDGYGTLWARLVCVLLLGLGTVVGVAAVPASADGRGPGRAHPATWFGSYATFGGDPWAWCVDAGRAAPDPGPGWSGTPVRAPAVNYLLTRHAADASPANHAALSYLVHTSPDLPHDARTAVPPSPPELSGMDLPGRVAALREDAARHAGPYTARVHVELSADSSAGTVRAALVSAAGVPAAGWAARLEVTGPATLAGGSPAAETTTGDGESTWELVTSGPGRVTATLTVQAPRDDVTLHTSSRAGVQRVVTQTGTAPVRASTAVDVVRPFAPQVTTRTTEEVVRAGDRLADVLTVATRDGAEWTPGAGVTVTSTLWGPFSRRPGEADAAPAGAPVVGRVETVVDGPGEVTTPELTVPAPGYYVWTESIDADARQTGWAGRFGLAAETTVAPWAPQVSTQASDQSADVGAVITDTLTVTGLPEDFGEAPEDDARLVVTLYGPFEAPPRDGDCTDRAPAVGRQELIARNGTLVTGGFGPLPAPGWYTFVEHLPGQERVTEHTGPCGAAAETVLVPAPPPAVAPPAEQPPAAAPATPPATSAAPAVVPSRLPRTGARVGDSAIAGAALVAAGAGALLAARPRRRGRHVAGRAEVVSVRPGSRGRSGWTPQRPG